MNKTQKIAVAAAVVLAAVPVVAYGIIWLLGERIIARKYDIPPSSVARSSDPAIIKEGERLSEIAGCRGCHGADLNGKPFGEQRFVFRSTTANIPRLAATYSDDDLARAIRHGVKQNGRSVYGMPSPGFYHMRDDDVAAIISFIRVQTDAGERLPATEIRILGRLEILQGRFPPEATLINHEAPRRAFDFAKPVERGEYLARVACAECHGVDFKGEPGGPGPGAPPDLAIAAGYPLDQFKHLMRTGEPIGGRDLDLMDEVARDRFTSFTDEEIDALHAFFVARADRLAE